MGEGHCLGSGLTAVNTFLAALDGLTAAIALFQLLRLYLQNQWRHCTRQKVFQTLIGTSNLGYLVYFVVTPIAKCYGWSCWSDACGFVMMALFKILFISTFLLLLSFWVDICHQDTDMEDDEEDEDEQEYMPLLAPGTLTEHESRSHPRKQWKYCVCWHQPCVRSRQKFVIVVVVLLCLLTLYFALLIWIGMGENNPIDSATLAKVYSGLLAVIMLISGSGLAGYGILLHHKLCKLRSERAASDMRKVAVLTVVSVLSFSLQAFMALCTDMPALDIWQSWDLFGAQSSALVFIYYFIGESIPSFVVLWVMRELPSNTPGNCGCPRLAIAENCCISNQTLTQHWMGHKDEEYYCVTSDSIIRQTTGSQECRHEILF